MADEPSNENNIEESKPQESPEKADKAPVRREKRQRRRPQNWSQSSGQSGENYRRPATRFRSRRKVCAFCADKVKAINWKDVGTLRRFVGSNGSIRARRKTGTCAKHQRQLAAAIKRARHLALMPFTDEHLRLAGKH